MRALPRSPALQQTAARASRTHGHRPGIGLPRGTLPRRASLRAGPRSSTVERRARAALGSELRELGAVLEASYASAPPHPRRRAGRFRPAAPSIRSSSTSSPCAWRGSRARRSTTTPSVTGSRRSGRSRRTTCGRRSSIRARRRRRCARRDGDVLALALQVRAARLQVRAARGRPRRPERGARRRRARAAGAPARRLLRQASRRRSSAPTGSTRRASTRSCSAVGREPGGRPVVEGRRADCFLRRPALALSPPRPVERLAVARCDHARGARGARALRRRRAEPPAASRRPRRPGSSSRASASSASGRRTRRWSGGASRSASCSGRAPFRRFAASTVGFALIHRTRPSLHLCTGGVFGVLYLATGVLAASVAAHWAYNVLVARARRSRATRGDRRRRERRRRSSE